MTVPIIDQYGLDAVIETYNRGGIVRCPMLAWLDFATTPRPVWAGEYNLASGGQTWLGLGKAGFLISMDNMEQASTLEAASFTVTLSGVDADLIAAAASTDRGDYVGRLFVAYAQFLDEDWQPLANPMAIACGFMGTMNTTRNMGEAGLFTRTISLPINNMFFGRGISTASMWSDTDQQQRFPGIGDTGFQFMAKLQDYEIKQPWN
jgi:hypothetical protein